MKTVREAQELILSHASPLGTENINLKSAFGKVIAEDVYSNRNHPPSDISAMDGYAALHIDIINATKDNPALLSIIDDIKAGAEPKAAVRPGCASRIMTGAPIPENADTVIRVEDTDCTQETVKVFAPYPEGANIRRLAENLKIGDMVLSKDSVLTPAAIGILSMVKKSEALVYKSPSVAILSTGDELEGLDEPLDPKKIPDANSYTVMAELQSLGIEPKLLGIARDTPGSLEEMLKLGLDHDILIVSGGVSVGHHDFVRPTLSSLDIKMHFWRVALRPGHPFAFGTGTGKSTPLVFALPGNPVSSMVCCAQFIIPALRKMTGHKEIFRRTIKAKLSGNATDKLGRINFMRVRIDCAGDVPTASLTGSQGSGILMSMVEANGLLVVPSETDSIEDGSNVTVQLLHGSAFQKEPGLPEN